ncbi:Protein translocase subunit SecY [Poriferisphaera corsica]|uniref:Protein translocase subunit SecY n=1 Tax=Poriferisphaera corsica TaxID=2528020 RepID=A0A517YSZ3_9BACT|nr:preprotein translocase subunit SecY [Poriferisphaera corsica]QDU33357.1 Protein translocase subunit SecY [Poriferisphaera corsica]
MLQAFFNIFRIRELRVKLLFTLAMLAIYRIGFFITLPGVNQIALKEWAEKAEGGAVGNLIAYVGIFTGGNLAQSTIFGLGIMPYISAAIIFQLLGTVWEPLKALQKEGPAGRQKIQEYTRYATVALCLVQSVFWLKFLQSGASPLVYPEYVGGLLFWVTGVVCLTAGTVFLMWLGEQIDKYGIGNGISLIITAGIIAGMPAAIGTIYDGFSLNAGDAQYGPMTVVFLVAAFIAVVAGAIIITQGQRRIPIQQAKHTRGRRVYGGQKSYLPLRVNHGGVMPIIFAQSLMIFPSMLVGLLNNTVGNDSPVWWAYVVRILNENFANLQGYLYVLAFVGMIFFFAYFWTTVQFQPKEMANQLRDHGSFIPGRRPGPRTAEYLETVMERITYVGAGFLAVIAIIPTIVAGLMNVDFRVSQFLGGTGLLIVVSVMLDFVQRIEAQLLMRNYPGFLAQGDGKGPKIRGARH